MCRPSHYTVAYEINPWMSLRRKPNRTRAALQWDHLYRTLTRTLGVRVRLVPPRAGVPDLVFTANAGLVHGRTVVRSNFRFSQRQREEPIMERFFRAARFRVVTLNRRYGFEGEGDALWAGSTLVFGFRYRSDAGAHEELARILKARVLPVELADTRFYHLDTCFAPLDARTGVWFPKAFDRYGRRVLEHLMPDLIAVTEADAKRFVCNAIPVPAPAGAKDGPGGRVVVQAGLSKALARRIERRRFALYPVDLSEFLKAGGSAKCLVLRLG